MRVVALSLLFVFVLVGALIVTMPLSFVLDRTPAKQLGVNWASAAGTIYSGTVYGVSTGPQSIGDVSVKLDPIGLIRGRVDYDVNWSGSPGSGTASLSVGRNSIALSDLNAVVDIEPLVGLANELRRIGGSASVRSGGIVFADNACVEAAGQVSTNMLARAATSYGQSGGELAGQMSCDGSMLSIPLSGVLSEGDTVDAEIRVGLSEPSSFSSDVQTTNPELSALLTFRGFERVGDRFSYNRSIQIGEF